MTESSDTKHIVLTGDVIGKQGKGRRSRKNQKGGGSTQGGTIVQLNSTSSSTVESEIQGTNPSKLAETAAVLPVMTGGKVKEKVKVVLKELPKKKSNVVLSVNKINTLKPIQDTKSKTRKSSKKILFSLKNLRKKLSTAKTIKKHSQEKSLDEIKKTLEEAKLIKIGSRAPE